MEREILTFIEHLRSHGIRVSTAETLDSMRCAAVPGILANRERLHAALGAAIVTRLSQKQTFDAIFALFFGFAPISAFSSKEATAGGSIDSDSNDIPGQEASTEPEHFDGTVDEEATGSPPTDGDDLTSLFDEDSLHEGVGLDDDDTAVGNISTPGDEIGLNADASGTGSAPQIQLDLTQSGGAEMPGALTPATGTAIDLELSNEEGRTLLSWLGSSASLEEPSDEDITELLETLPSSIAEHVQHLVDLHRAETVSENIAPGVVDEVAERERELLEESLRRLAKSLRGGLAQRRKTSPNGRVHPALTTRRSLRFDGIPFQPVTVSRRHDRSRVIILADVSLSVRATARFTLHMVHSMHKAFGKPRTFAFVDELIEITTLFERHPLEHALGLVFGGDVLDTERNSDYGAVWRQLLAEGEHLDRRTSIVILGDGRSNGKDPATDALTEIARRVRRIVWLTPEPSYSWGLGACDLPEYAELCERVEVVRDLTGLERTAEKLALP